jgi:hypothetical protein
MVWSPAAGRVPALVPVLVLVLESEPVPVPVLERLSV